MINELLGVGLAIFIAILIAWLFGNPTGRMIE